MLPRHLTVGATCAARLYTLVIWSCPHMIEPFQSIWKHVSMWNPFTNSFKNFRNFRFTVFKKFIRLYKFFWTAHSLTVRSEKPKSSAAFFLSEFMEHSLHPLSLQTWLMQIYGLHQPPESRNEGQAMCLWELRAMNPPCLRCQYKKRIKLFCLNGTRFQPGYKLRKEKINQVFKI